MRVTLDYGRTGLVVELPDANVVGPLAIRPARPLAKPQAAVEEALQKPIGTPPLAELARRGRCTVADLQQHALLETIYRPADAVGALTSAVSAGTITREPEKGRLTPRTVVMPSAGHVR